VQSSRGRELEKKMFIVIKLQVGEENEFNPSSADIRVCCAINQQSTSVAARVTVAEPCKVEHIL